MISKELLDQVVAFELDQRQTGHYKICDIFTLHLRQTGWWGKKKTIRLQYSRITKDINKETETFTHSMSEQAKYILDLLNNHLCDTYVDEDTPEVTKEGNVFKVNFKKDEEDK